jgi:hypothetical protein
MLHYSANTCRVKAQFYRAARLCGTIQMICQHRPTRNIKGYRWLKLVMVVAYKTPSL